MFKHTPISLGYDNLESETNKSGRKYVTPTGVSYPSITTVLSILSEESIAKWKKQVGEQEANKISTRASRRGTSVHEALENFVDNEDWESIKKKYTPDIIQSVLGIKDILNERIGNVFGQEFPLYSDHLGVAGRVDCVAEFDGKPSIIDYKTSRKPKRKQWCTNYFCQETAYAIMWEERTGMPITQLVTIIAVDNSKPQVFVEHRDNWTKMLKETIYEYEKRNPVINSIFA